MNIVNTFIVGFNLHKDLFFLWGFCMAWVEEEPIRAGLHPAPQAYHQPRTDVYGDHPVGYASSSWKPLVKQAWALRVNGRLCFHPELWAETGHCTFRRSGRCWRGPAFTGPHPLPAQPRTTVPASGPITPSSAFSPCTGFSCFFSFFPRVQP